MTLKFLEDADDIVKSFVKTRLSATSPIHDKTFTVPLEEFDRTHYLAAY